MHTFIDDVVITLAEARNSLTMDNETLSVKRTIAYALAGYLALESPYGIEYVKAQQLIGCLEDDKFTLWNDTEELKSNLLLIMKQCYIDTSEFEKGK